MKICRICCASSAVIKQAKLFKLMRFAGSGKDVSDPWYTGDFSAAYSDIETGCKALFARLENFLKKCLTLCIMCAMI